MVQLPDDAESKGYRQTKPFHFEQIFFSPSNDFTGTEEEFVSKGIGYQYKQIDKFTRLAI